MTNKPYGYCYDKQGNLKEVSAPVNEVQRVIPATTWTGRDEVLPSLVVENRRKPKTKTGALHNSVGFSASK